VRWELVRVFWGDERCVPPDHVESNYRMVREALLGRIEVPPENIHRMAGEKDPAAGAAEYERELHNFFQTDGAAPRFDLVLLGLGEDGHTASLFPGTPAPDETHKLVTTVYVERLNAHRLTITLPVINAAAQISFLVAGESKSAIVTNLLSPGSNPAQYPAGRVMPASGKLTWFITEDAGAAISSSAKE
jgi:6-phosphogluconolactonase